MRFPPPGTLLTPVFPAPTNARTFVILRLLGVFAGVLAKAVGGQMPADQETIRYTGVYGQTADGEPYLMREVLGGGSGGRYYADGEDTIHVVPDSRNLPAEFTEARFPLLVERLGLAVDSGGPGQFRGGLGYEKVLRMRADGYFMSIADRSILSCWGVNGGRAGRPFQVTIDPGGPGRARGGRAGRRRVRAGRDADPDPHHRRRRLGRPAGPRPGPGGARRALGQGVSGGRGRRLRRGSRRAGRRPGRRRDGDQGAARPTSAQPGQRASHSSTEDLATRSRRRATAAEVDWL